MPVTSDATSGVFIPQNASEWTTFNASNGWANPDHLYLFQETGTNPTILDKIGTSNLTTAGSPTAAATITGWSTKALQFTNGTLAQRTKSTSITDISTNSALLLFYASTPTQPGSNLGFAFLGTTTNSAKFTMLTTDAYRVDSVANTSSDTVTSENSASVKCFVLAVNRTSNFVKGYCTSMAAIKQPTFASGMTGNELCFGSVDNGSVATIALNVLYAAVWVGSNAEKTDQDIKSLMMQLGNGFWTPTWTVAYTGALSETESLSESTAAVFNVIQGVSETNNLAESESSLYSAIPAVSDTDNLTESSTSLFAATQGVSETNTLTESESTSVGLVYGVSEVATLAESNAASYSAIPNASETNTLTEAESSLYSANPNTAETDSLTETTSAGFAATQSLVETDILNESLAPRVSFFGSMSESAALVEALLGSQGLHYNVSESFTLAELISLLYAAIVAAPDSLILIENLFVVYATTAGLTESEAIAEALQVLNGIPRRELSGVLTALNALLGRLSEDSPWSGVLTDRSWSGTLVKD